MKHLRSAALAAALAFIGSTASADVLKMAMIDPLSGPMASSGQPAFTSFVLAAEHINAGGGVNGDSIEIVPFDNKLSPQESLVQLQKAIDSGIRYIIQGNGSSVAAALIEAVNKWNERNPGDEVVFFNYAAVTPAFTNENCSFWHFRFDAHADMKMNAITDWIAARPDIKKIYIIGQDYVFGKAVAAAAVSQLTAKRPDIEIVGNELHPLAKVTDFTPYVQKIKASGADAVITGNWGQDMTLLVKAANDSGSDIPYLTFYGGSLGAVAALGKGSIGKLYQVTEAITNLPADQKQDDIIKEYKKRYPEYDYYYHRAFNTLYMFTKAASKAGTNDVIPVAKAMEGMDLDEAYGKVHMRAEDHQVQQDLYISTVAPVGGGVMFGVDNIDLGWKMVDGGKIDAAKAEEPTTCKMQRPD
jgi:branched-chain amino acid transport system substrate-binding protein